MEQLASHVAAHHGVLTRAEALTFGTTDGQIRRRLRTGEWIIVHRGVYRVATAPDTWEARVRAAALAVRGLGSHSTSLRAWGVDGFGRSSHVHISTRHGRSARSLAGATPDVRLHRSSSMALAGGRLVAGIPVTSVTRAVVDMAALADDDGLDQIVDAVIRQGLCRLIDLVDEVERHGTAGRTGAGRLRRLLDERDPGQRLPDSRFNRLVGQLLIAAGLEPPVYEHDVRAGRRSFRLDLAYPDKGLGIECDSARWHHNRASFEADPRRRNLLLAAGYRVLSFTWSDYAQRPGELVATVRSALNQVA